MSSSSNINCCVPLCNQRGIVDANGKRVGFFNFPKDPNLRAQWLQKIRRDVRTKFKLTEITKVCSLHFRESEIKKDLGGKKMSVDITAVPSKFAWRTSPRKRPPPSARFFPKKRKRRLEESFTEESFTVSSDITSKADDTVSLETAEIVNTESQDSCESLRFQLFQAQEETARLDEEVSILKEKLGNVEAQLRNAQAEIKRQLEENGELKSCIFCIDNLSGDESISFYTGFPNVQTFQATLVYLNPGENGQNIRYWRSTDKKVQAHNYDGDNQKNKPGRKRTLKPEDEFFLVMCRLQQGFNEAHLAFLFGISQPTVSRIFVSWINFMYLRFGTINIWPNREEVDKSMPEDFKSINKIKNFHIWDRITQLTSIPLVNQMWTVCSFLCNVQDPILSE